MAARSSDAHHGAAFLGWSFCSQIPAKQILENRLKYFGGGLR
jgi:hypothetical protein